MKKKKANKKNIYMMLIRSLFVIIRIVKEFFLFDTDEDKNICLSFKSDRQRSLAFLVFVYYKIVQYHVMFVDHHQ